MRLCQQGLLCWRDPSVLQGVVGHEDVVEGGHEDTEGAGEVEEELPADVVDDGAGEAEEDPSELDAEEDADAHPARSK